MFERLAQELGIEAEEQDQEELTLLLKTLFDNQSFVVIMINTQRGDTPIGIMEVIDRGNYVEPHALWFPWATNRNITEGTLSFLNETRATRNILVFARKETRKFWARMKEFGVLARVGTIPRYFKDESEAQLWRSA